LDGRPFCEQERVNVDYLVAAQGLDLGEPPIPAQRLIELAELFGHCPDKKLRVTKVTRLPLKRIGSVEVDLAKVFTQSTAIECEKPSNNVVRHQVKPIRPAFVPLR